MLKSKKRMTKMPRMTVITTPMFRTKVPMMASVYVPRSSTLEKKRRLTKKGGFSDWQVSHQSLGIGKLKKGKIVKIRLQHI